MNLKQLRADSKMLPAIVRIGKFGLTENQVTEVKKVLKTKKLVKVSLLKSCGESAKDIASALVDQTNAMLVSVVGRTVVLWKR